jgi:RNA polymerase sigma factor (sigma-70 family)
MYFEEIIKRLRPKLKGIAYKLNRRCGSLNEEDLYQEGLVYLWDSFNRGLLEVKTESYILQGCYFHLKNYLRVNLKRVNFVSLCSEDGREEDIKLEDVLTADESYKSTYLAYLNDKFLTETILNNGLTPKEKKILYFYAQGLTTREIGRRLGVSHVSVVKSTKRIREKCLRYLDTD